MTLDELLSLKWMDGLPERLYAAEDPSVPFDPPDHCGVERTATGLSLHPVMLRHFEAFLESQGVNVPEQVRIFRERN